MWQSETLDVFATRATDIDAFIATGLYNGSASSGSDSDTLACTVAAHASRTADVRRSFYRCGSTYFPAQYTNKVGGHVPVLTLSGTTATVTVSHGMSSSHYITSVWVNDQLGNPIFFHNFNPSDAAPTVSFEVPRGVTHLTPFENCNLHQVWHGNTISVDAQSRAAAWEALNIMYTGVYYPPVGHSVPKHEPLITVSGTTATLTVGSGIVHPMSSQHHISAAWVRDQTGMVVFYQAFATDGSETPVVSFTVPAGSTALTPYEHCNLHGTWMGATYYPAWEATASSLTAANTMAGGFEYNATYYPAVGHSVAKHVPLLNVSGMTAMVVVGAIVHPQSNSHYISSAWIRDDTGNIIFRTTFDYANGEDPIVSFPVPVGVASLTAFEHCNLCAALTAAAIGPPMPPVLLNPLFSCR